MKTVSMRDVIDSEQFTMADLPIWADELEERGEQGLADGIRIIAKGRRRENQNEFSPNTDKYCYWWWLDEPSYLPKNGLNDRLFAVVHKLSDDELRRTWSEAHLEQVAPFNSRSKAYLALAQAYSEVGNADGK